MVRLSAAPWRDGDENRLTKNQLIEKVGLVAVHRGAAAFLRMHNDYTPSFAATKAKEDVRLLSSDISVNPEAVRAVWNRHRFSNFTR